MFRGGRGVGIVRSIRGHGPRRRREGVSARRSPCTAEETHEDEHTRVLGLAATAILVAACSSPSATTAPTAAPSTAPTDAPASVPASVTPSESAAPPSTAPAAASVKLQLQWTPQAQFAGYFAADKLGYYAAEGLTVDMLDGGPTVVPQQVGSAPDGPEFTISWVPEGPARPARPAPISSTSPRSSSAPAP